MTPKSFSPSGGDHVAKRNRGSGFGGRRTSSNRREGPDHQRENWGEDGWVTNVTAYHKDWERQSIHGRAEGQNLLEKPADSNLKREGRGRSKSHKNTFLMIKSDPSSRRARKSSDRFVEVAAAQAKGDQGGGGPCSHSFFYSAAGT